MRLLLLFLLFYIPVVQAQPDDLLERLLVHSGLEVVVRSYPQQLAAQFDRAGVVEEGDGSRQIARQRLLDSYHAIDTVAELRTYVQDELSAQDIRSIVTWFESPLGRRFARAEQQTGAVSVREQLEQLDNIPLDSERFRLLQQFVRVARLSAINMAIIKVMVESELLAVNDARAQTRRHTATRMNQDMQQQFYQMQTMIMPGLMKRMLAASNFTMRDFSDVEIKAYINFLDSGAGRKLVILYGRAPVYMFARVVRRAGMDITDGFLQLP